MTSTSQITCSFVHGRWLPPEPLEWAGERLDNANPATGTSHGEILAADASIVDAAVRSAQDCFELDWRHRAPAMRAALLRRFAELVRENSELLAQYDAIDTGKPAKTAHGSAMRGAQILEHYASVAEAWQWSHIPIDPANSVDVWYEPYGAVAAIIPWNFPTTNFLIKAAPALACGNTVVVKPSEHAPLTASKLGELALEAGFPTGCVNVLQGGPRTGQELVTHPGIKKVAFTGSTATGASLMASVTTQPRNFSMELGGKTANIVFADADLDSACDAAVFTAFSNAGQTCTAGTRLLVHESIADDFITRVVKAASQLRIGEPFDPDTQIGPVISDHHLERLLSTIQTCLEEGATLLGGGHRLELAGPAAGGYYLEPTILTDVAETSVVWRQELFGPVLTVATFSDFDEALRQANATEYGLATTIWTSDLACARRAAQAVESGIVWINTVHALHPGVPYAGWKNSGVGTESGREGALEYMQMKSVWVNSGPWVSPWA